MKIALFAQGLTNRAGIERMTIELAHLLSSQHSVSIIIIEPFSHKQLPYPIADNIEIITLNSYFSLLNLNNIILLRYILKKNRPDVLITVATPLVRISALAVIGLKIKNIGWEHFNLYAGSKISSLWKIISTYLVDKTVVLTERDAQNFTSLYARNVVVIPNFSTIGENIPSNCNSKILLAIGRHMPQKGFDMLIKAWAKVSAPDWKLTIIGNGDLKKENIALAQKMGVANTIIFKDSTPNIVAEYQKASCFVLSSKFEGLVMVLIEAKLMGLPCISFDCPYGPREIIRDGIDGWLVKNGDIEMLSEMITKVLKFSNLKSYGYKARLDASLRYSPTSICDKWDSILQNTYKKYDSKS